MTTAARRLIADARYEVIPLKSLNDQIAHLPRNASVSVTCSPKKGIGVTLDLAAELSRNGHMAVPHIAARLVEDRDHVDKIAARLAEADITEIFVVGGDPDPVGPYRDGLSLMKDLLPAASSVRTVGFPAYPDHHASIPDTVLDQALMDKQALAESLGLATFASTQMCFAPRTIVHWLELQRRRGMHTPIHLGVPGAVERTRLLNLSTKLGVGSSLRYLRKNTGAIMRMFAPAGYNPAKLIHPMARHADELGITGVHLFTFNSIEATAAWQHRELS